jgi:hypothetical protein
MKIRSQLAFACLGAGARYASGTPASALLVLEKGQSTLAIVDPAALTNRREQSNRSGAPSCKFVE